MPELLSQCLGTEAKRPRATAAEACARARALQLEKSPRSKDPAQPKINKYIYFFKEAESRSVSGWLENRVEGLPWWSSG